MLNKTIAALSDPTRRKILELLKTETLNAGEIASNFNISKPSISHHLSILKNSDLISSVRDGQEIIYSLNVTVFDEVAVLLIEFFRK
ncbi:winged helix-turn-helix transcriptional regulator [Candidatus Falkowbacteria bacterium]|jgi:ArsR family transcriptional regulator, arsenate/arsenite/antimonite-responsive transcriptional repressor|nr:winged helix-turn-helix transcriptional regulator [Candidatus Falkowbacteria bacterium]